MANNPEAHLDALTPAELKVMQVLWKQGELKPAEILDRLDSGRPVSNPALRSVLRILVEKGHLTRRKEGKAYYYRPARPAEKAVRNLTRKISEIFFGGSPAELIAHLIRTESLSANEIRELERIAQGKTPTEPTHED